MSVLKPEEQTFLNNIKSELKDGANEMIILNALRKIENLYFQRGKKQGKGGWDVDHIWNDDQLK